MTKIIDSLADISASYDAVFCDLWGCLHNGIKAHDAAVAALRAFKSDGGTVILLTNAPRQRASVEAQLARFQTPRDCWDSIATSGDSARMAMFQGAIGDKVYFIGQPHDEIFFDPIRIVDDPITIQRTELDDATGILCTSPFDSFADPAVMRPTFLHAIARGLPMLCANPDVVVDRGDTREWCAGALAALYREMGGETLMYGKPHPGVYDLARRRMIELGKDIPDRRILCIGDGINTDIQGAMGEDLDSLFITGGLAAAQTRTDYQPDPGALQEFLATATTTPTFAIGQLR
ncbi:TIGR01459 family HAD-type hydrolase [Oceaniglobus ichthyenteri]|uniref:TIGR01459 family HAD-type hydrolase n=1 Tax=Oceaniglobus ichthyenteri TaxID=2136177 RepID=UPI000D3B4565|nr:TIGR01459 family HAD-type hydrolase [Oceaniglobus ichthyenteri]